MADVARSGQWIALALSLLVTAAALPAATAGAAPSLSICMHTEGENGEQSDCPPAGLDTVFRFYNSRWNPTFGPEIAIVHDEVSATWSVLSGDASVYAKYGGQVPSGFVNDFNSSHASLDADDFVITGPAGSVEFRLNVFVTGALHAASSDMSRFLPSTGVGVSGNIITPTQTCQMSIAGGQANSGGKAGFGAWATRVGGPALFTSDPCHVNTGDSFRIRIDLNAGASLITPFPSDLPGPGTEGSASGHIAASLPAHGAVFVLPVGYTANSPTAQVESNGYLPEPDPSAEVAIACLALFVLRRTRAAPGGAP